MATRSRRQANKDAVNQCLNSTTNAIMYLKRILENLSGSEETAIAIVTDYISDGNSDIKTSYDEIVPLISLSIAQLMELEEVINVLRRYI